MNAKFPTNLSDAQLIEDYVSSAQSWGDASESSEISRANKVMRRLVCLSDELKTRGATSRLKLEPFLDSMDPATRYLAAYHLLTLLPERSRAAIESVVEAGRYGISFDARMTLGFFDERVGTST